MYVCPAEEECIPNTHLKVKKRVGNGIKISRGKTQHDHIERISRMFDWTTS